MVGNTSTSWKTGTHTGNRHGHEPARMVGNYLCSEKREPRTEAGGVMQTCDQGPGAIHGCGLWSRIFLAFVAVFLAVAAHAATPSANVAGGVLAPPLVDRPPTPEELAAAKGMEQMLADLLIQEMRKSVPENDLVPVSQGERVFRQMLDNEYARVIGDAGMLGIADLVLAQMRGKR